MTPISLQLYSLRQAAAQDLFKVLKDVAEIGYKGVEFAGLHGKKPAEVRKVLDDLGLVCSSAHMSLPTRENLNEMVDTAKTLGFDMIISGKGASEFKTRQSIKAVADAFEAAAALLKPYGLRMGYHNHYWEMDMVEGRIGYEILLEAMPNVFGQLDVYWASNFGKVDVPAFIAKHKGRLPYLHIKDGSLVKGEPHTAVGGGKMNIPACVRAADSKVLEWLVVELDNCATDMLTAVRQSYAYLVKNRLGEGTKPA